LLADSARLPKTVALAVWRHESHTAGACGCAGQHWLHSSDSIQFNEVPSSARWQIQRCYRDASKDIDCNEFVFVSGLSWCFAKHKCLAGTIFDAVVARIAHLDRWFMENRKTPQDRRYAYPFKMDVFFHLPIITLNKQKTILFEFHAISKASVN
jgi:hypothetical protein